METAVPPMEPQAADPPDGGRRDALDQLSVALDFPSAAAALGLVDQLQGACRWFKVGMELYYAAGNSIIERLRERGFEVFLDLKLHDIPNTVAGAVRSVSSTGASLLTLHAAGGEAMMRAAAQAAAVPGGPKLLAVTVLTSMDEAALTAVGFAGAPGSKIQAQAMRLARLAQSSGIDGLVCSAEEVAALREALGPNALLVVPGIRPVGAETGDQRRIATPAEAISRGASMLVVGRPITQASDPARAAEAILAEMKIKPAG